MKNLLLTSLVLLFGLMSCGPTAQEAAEYNDAIVAHQKKVLDKVTELDNAIGNFDEKLMEKSFAEVNSTVETALTEINKMDEFEGAEDLKKAAVDYFQTFKTLLGEFYPQLMEVFKLNPENYTSTEKRIADSLQTIINQKHKESQQVLLKAQEEFAKKNNIELE